MKVTKIIKKIIEIEKKYEEKSINVIEKFKKETKEKRKIFKKNKTEFKKKIKVKKMNKIPGQNFVISYRIALKNIQLKKRFTSMATMMKMKKNEEEEIDEIEEKLLGEEKKENLKKNSKKNKNSKTEVDKPNLTEKEMTEEEEEKIKEIFSTLFVFDAFPEEIVDTILTSLIYVIHLMSNIHD